jgi:RND family efflux transporter MFP subunit
MKLRIFSSFQGLYNKLQNSSLPPVLKKKSILIAAPAALFILLTLIIINSITSVVSSIPVYKARRGNFLVSITESGELRAKNSISIVSPRVRGNIKIIYLIPEGTYVKAGDIVVKFDPTESMNTLQDAQAKLELALSDKEKLVANHKSAQAQWEADLKSSELTYELSKLNLEQMKFEAEAKQREAKLNHQKDVLSFERAKKDIQSKIIVQRSELSRADIEIKQRKADLDKAKTEVEQLTLKAPSEGLAVYETNWSTGRKVIVGDNVWGGMPIVTLPDLSTMESLTYVNEVDVSRVAKNQKVQVRLDAFQDSSFYGTIVDVASLGKSKDNNNPNIKVFEIAVGLKGRSAILKPGMTTSNKFIINEIPNVISIPQEAVFEKYGKKLVYIKNGSGFKETSIVTGEKGENLIIIRRGLNQGDLVALRDPTTENESSKKDKKDTIKMPSKS